MKEAKKERTHKLLIKVRDKSRLITLDEEGRQLIPVKWEEVIDANLGSMSKPNKNIFGCKFVPIKYEEDKKPKDFRDIFKGFLDK